MKLVRNALNAPMTKVDVPAGGPGGGVDDHWRQIAIVGPYDTGAAVDVAVGVHESRRMFEINFWYHQLALVLGGEMVVQNLDTGEVYRGHEGDLFYWGPGLHARLGGEFKAYGVKTPVPLRWVQTPQGKKEVVMQTLENEITFPGSEPDEVRPEIIRPRDTSHPRIKFVRGAMAVDPVKVDDPDAVGKIGGRSPLSIPSTPTWR
jgi:hypothetical protein